MQGVDPVRGDSRRADRRSRARDGVRVRGSDRQRLREYRASECPRKNVWLSILTSMFLHGEHPAHRGEHAVLVGVRQQRRGPAGKAQVLALLSACPASRRRTRSRTSSRARRRRSSARPGAIAGILGAYMLDVPEGADQARSCSSLPHHDDRAPRRGLPIGALVLACSSSRAWDRSPADTGVAYMAHIGGFLAGMLLYCWFPAEARPSRSAYPLLSRGGRGSVSFITGADRRAFAGDLPVRGDVLGELLARDRSEATSREEPLRVAS